MHAHLVQLDSVWEDRAANHRRVRELLSSHNDAIRRGDLVVLPEMFDSGFSFNLEVTADTDGQTLAFLQSLARELRITLHGSRTVLGPDRRGRNRATIVGPGGDVLCEYDKIHPFSFGRECERFTGGDAVTTYTWQSSTPGREGSIVVCPAICYDMRFPELFRTGLRQGAEMFVIGANWPLPRKVHREVLSVARAIENQAYVLTVNRAGRDPFLEYAGGSMAIDPKGEVIRRLDERESVMSVEIDPRLVRSWRDQFPATRDIRLL